MAIPNLKDQVSQFENIYQSELSKLITKPNPLKSASGLSLVRTGVLALQEAFIFLQRTQDNNFPDSADNVDLLRLGASRGFSLRASTYATGNVNIVGTAGTTLATDTEVTSSIGKSYRFQGGVVLDSEGLGSIRVLAVEPGTASNLESGELSLNQPDPDITSITIDNEGIVGGVEEQSIDSFRSDLVLGGISSLRTGKSQETTLRGLERQAVWLKKVLRTKTQIWRVHFICMYIILLLRLPMLFWNKYKAI